MKKILLSCLLFVSLSAVHIENIEDLNEHIEVAYKEEFDAVGMIFCGGHYGSGTLIHPKVVLTAAHVVEGQTDITFYLSINNEYVRIVKGKAIIHPEYQKKSMNSDGNIHLDNMPYDVALLFLEEAIEEVDYPTLSSSPAPTPSDYYAVGYGLWNGEPPETLLERKLLGISLVASLSDDNALIYTHCSNFMDINLFGTGRPGDSGGPLMRIENEKVIYGILSCLMHEEDADQKDETILPLFSVHSSVHSYLEWLLETMEKTL